METRDRIQKELKIALKAREKGNEGMARVCARRAAGMAVREYLDQQGRDAENLNNYEILLDPGIREILPEKIIPSLEHLTMRVDENYKLPAEIDLIADAETVIRDVMEETDVDMEETHPKIIMYGTTWCGSTKRARRVFEEEKIDYEWIDIDRDETAAKFVESVANGFRSVPTIVFPDGSILVEPSTYQLREKLGV